MELNKNYLETSNFVVCLNFWIVKIAQTIVEIALG